MAEYDAQVWREDKAVTWRFFAGTMLGIAGIMRVFDGIWALHYHGTLPSNFDGALLGHSLKTYGWLYLILGIVLLATSVGVVLGSQLSRWTAVVIGAPLLAISAGWWLPFYPVWALVYIGIGILVMYALIAHGRPRSVEQSPH